MVVNLVSAEVVDDAINASKAAINGIYPVFSESCLDQLRQFCENFNILFERATGIENQSTKDTNPGLVGSYGSTSKCAAEVYGHLTGRNATKLTDNPEEWPTGLSIIVGLTNDLNSKIIGELDKRIGRGQCISILWSTSETGLYLNLAKSAASLHVAKEQSPFIVDIFPHAEGPAISTETRLILGRSSSSVISSIKGVTPDVLHISAHSDGVDLELPRSVLCGVKSAFERGLPVPKTKKPCCLTTDFCHRLNIDLNTAIRAKNTLTTSNFSAKVLFLDSCSGVVPSDSLVDNGWSLLSSFSQSPAIGITLATPDYIFGSPFDRDFLIQQLMYGQSVGEATIAAASVEAPIEARQHRFLVFGDPEFTPFERLKDSNFIVHQNANPVKRKASNAEMIIKRVGRETVNFVELLESFSELGWARLIEAAMASSQSLNFNEDNKLCGNCSSKTRVFCCSYEGSNERFIRFCIMCGPVACWPSDRSEPSLVEASGNKLTISSYVPYGPWVGAAYRWGFDFANMVMEPWAKGAHGGPERCHKFSAEATPIHQRKGAIFIDKDWFLVTSPEISIDI